MAAPADPIIPLVTEIIPDGITPKETSDFYEVVTRLAFFDSIHDFWRERKTVSVEDDDDVIDVPLDRLNLVRTNLEASIAGYLGIAGNIGAILNTSTNGAITSVSDIEDRVIKFLSMNFSPFNGQSAKITFDEILRDWIFIGGQWDAYKNRILALPDNLQIVGNGKSVKSLSDSERGSIGFFILAYMEPSVQPGTGGSVNFTFDMAPRDIGKLFMRFNQVRNAIYPQNIADSAPTSFSALQGRNEFFKADGAPGGNVQGADHIVRSNLFSVREGYEIRFVDNNFGSGNKFGFSIVIRKGADQYVIPFGNGAEQGPPVNYLMDIIASGSIAGKTPILGTAVKLPDNLPYSQNLMFDLKRMGDHEQMRVDGPYGVTGDRLAYVYRRLLRKPAIYHSHTEIRLSRVLGGEIDQKEIAFRNELFKCREVLEKVHVLFTYNSEYQTASSELRKMRTHIETAIRRGTVLMDPIDDLNDYAAKYTQISATFATFFVRLRMMDIMNYIDTIGPKMATIIQQSLALKPDIERVNTVLSTLTKDDIRDDMNLYDKEGRNITGIRISLEGFYNNDEELRNMNIVIDTTGKREPYYVELFDTTTYRLKKGVKSDLFNFSSGPYLHNDTGMQVAIARLLVAKRARRPDAVIKTINENLALYLHARDDAKEAFFDQDLLTQVEDATDISNELTPKQILGIHPFDPTKPDQNKNILTAITNLATLYKKLKPVEGGVKAPPSSSRLPLSIADAFGEPPRPKEAPQIDKYTSVLQCRDIHDLFMEICIDSETTNSVDELEVKWTLGVEDIRAQARDEYGLPFEYSFATDIITYFLAWRSNSQDSIPIFKLDGSKDPLSTQLSRRERGDTVILQDIGGAMLTLVAPNAREQLILTTLRTFSEQLKANPAFFEASGDDGTQNQWSGIPMALRNIVIALTGFRMRGGGLRTRRPLYSNVQVPDTARSESIEHPRLQQRSRTRRTTGVRRSTRKSKTR